MSAELRRRSPTAGGTFLSSYARTLSNGRLRFHTDRCDVVGLLCVRQARAGGESLLCSSPAVHNAMLERRPDLAASLYEDVWRSRLGEEAGATRWPIRSPSGACATDASPATTRSPISRRRSSRPTSRADAASARGHRAADGAGAGALASR